MYKSPTNIIDIDILLFQDSPIGNKFLIVGGFLMTKSDYKENKKIPIKKNNTYIMYRALN